MLHPLPARINNACADEPVDFCPISLKRAKLIRAGGGAK
jgi:hypothetical protein